MRCLQNLMRIFSNQLSRRVVLGYWVGCILHTNGFFIKWFVHQHKILYLIYGGHQRSNCMCDVWRYLYRMMYRIRGVYKFLIIPGFDLFLRHFDLHTTNIIDHKIKQLHMCVCAWVLCVGMFAHIRIWRKEI